MSLNLSRLGQGSLGNLKFAVYDSSLRMATYTGHAAASLGQVAASPSSLVETQRRAEHFLGSDFRFVRSKQRSSK